MVLIGCLQLVIVLTLVLTSKRRLEDALPFLCFFLVLMPLEARMVLPGLFDLNTMRVSLLTFFTLYLTRGPALESEPVPLRGLMGLHFAWAACSTIYSISFATSAKQLLSQVLEYYLLYFLFVKTVTETRTLYNVVYAMILAMTLCCIFSLVEVYGHWSILRIFPRELWITYNGGVDPLYVEWGRGLRARSTFPHPILFGDALAITIPLTLYLLSIWKQRAQRVLLWLGLALMVWAIYKTSSRGPWIATGLCMGLLCLMLRSKVRQYLATLALFASVLLVARPGIWSTVTGLYEATTDSSSPVGSSYLYREALTKAVKEAVAADPGRALLGYGLGTFRESGLDITFLDSVRHWYTCDNNWDAFLYETGYGGLFFISLLLFRALFLAFQNYRHLPEPANDFSGVLFIAMTGFYFLLLSVAGYSWGQQGYMNWILISLVVSLSRVGGQQPDVVESAQPLLLQEEESYDLYPA